MAVTNISTEKNWPKLPSQSHSPTNEMISGFVCIICLWH